jgi:hypothetical protein
MKNSANTISLSTTTYPLTSGNLDLIFKDKIHELAHIHNIEINIYSQKENY